METNDTQHNTNLTAILVRQRCKRLLFLVLIAIALVLLIRWLTPTTSTTSIYGDDPEWISDTIDTSSVIADVKGGPCVWSNNDYYLVYNFRFYDAGSKQQITDYEILEELLNMFQYSDEPFIYDRNRSFNGNCFIYYNGIIPADFAPILFTGFQGKDNFPSHSSEKIEAIRITYDIYCSDVFYKEDIQQRLDNMRISPSNNHYN